MHCFFHVLKIIIFFSIGFIVLGLTAAALIAAGVGTQKLFGWPDWAGMACFIVYFVVTIGTFVGVMECRQGLA